MTDDRKYVWRAWAHRVGYDVVYVGTLGSVMIAGHTTVAVHMTRVATLEPMCTVSDGELIPATGPTPNVIPTCKACLKLAEWMLNNPSKDPRDV